MTISNIQQIFNSASSHRSHFIADWVFNNQKICFVRCKYLINVLCWPLWIDLIDLWIKEKHVHAMQKSVINIWRRVTLFVITNGMSTSSYKMFGSALSKVSKGGNGQLNGKYFSLLMAHSLLKYLNTMCREEWHKLISFGALTLSVLPHISVRHFCFM